MSDVPESLASPSTSRWTLPELRPGRPASREIEAARLQRVPESPVSPGVRVQTETIAGIPCATCSPPTAHGVMLYLHGGAFWRGAPSMWIPYASRLASASSLRVVVPRYGLAPERPFPAAIHDALAVHRSLARSDEPLFVGGDSAGGGVAAALVLALVRMAGRLPDGLVLVSPWLDLTLEAGAFERNAARDKVFGHDAAVMSAERYLQGMDPRQELASPALASLHGFPPTLTLVGSEEVLLDDSIRFVENATLSGVTCEFHAFGGMQHVWPLLQPELHQSSLALQVIGAFVQRQRA